MLPVRAGRGRPGRQRDPLPPGDRDRATRAGQDLDFGSTSGSRRTLSDLLVEEGYQPDKNFNALLLAAGDRSAIAGGRLDPDEQLKALERAAEDAPKSRRWRMRSRIGERKRWCETPEETPHH